MIFSRIKWALGCTVFFPLSLLAGDASDSLFTYQADRFADVEVLRYQVPGFEQLSLKQKQLAYYLYEAGLSGRDIFWDQKNRHNLAVRKTLEGILETYSGPRSGSDWEYFLVYAKQVFFSSGMHHHYASNKILPAFPRAYLLELVQHSAPTSLPLAGKTPEAFAAALEPHLFSPDLDAKTVNLDAGIDNVAASANNFYRDVTAAEVAAFYEAKAKEPGNGRVMLGLNSRLEKKEGKIFENVWKVGGLYGPAIERIVGWLEKAVTVAEDEAQKRSLETLIAFYRSGDLADFDTYSVAWVADTHARLDVVNGFIETYNDAISKRGAYESVVSMRDEEATKLIATISSEAQWFEDHSPIMDAHKKKKVTGITAKVITVIGQAGATAPSGPIGINLPNSSWIREEHGSKSVSLGNIVYAHNQVQAKSPASEEFSYSPEVAARLKNWGALSGMLHTDMHEVIGHASGVVNEGVGQASATLKTYASTLEEARADLVALYYVLDPKLVELGVSPSLDVGRAEYDGYITNGLMRQLFRIRPGHQIEEAHMRNRQLVSAWAFEKGAAENVIERVRRDGKTYFKINDYEKLRVLFGQLLREIQRVKSEGDYEGGKALVETYGVKVDQELLAEVHARYEKLNLAPYSGFIQPRLVPVLKDGAIIDVKVEYPTDFVAQMLEYGKHYAYLPVTEPL